MINDTRITLLIDDFRASEPFSERRTIRVNRFEVGDVVALASWVNMNSWYGFVRISILMAKIVGRAHQERSNVIVSELNVREYFPQPSSDFGYDSFR